MKNYILLIMGFIFLFQYQLILIFPIFGLFDEICTTFFLIYILIYIAKFKRIEKNLLKLLISIILIIFVGILSSFISGLQLNKNIIVRDILYCFKVFICFIGAYLFSKNCDRKLIVKRLSFPLELIIIFSTICAILNQFMDIGMSTGKTLQFNIKNYAFIFNSNHVAMPGVFSMYLYMYITLFTMRLKYIYKDRKKRKYYFSIIICGLFNLICTLQSRAIAFTFIYISFYYLLIIKKMKMPKMNKKFFSYLKLRYIIPIGIVIIFIGRYKIGYFFIKGENTARYAFWLYGIKIMKEYFPLGSGFATFGTYEAFNNYSKLYLKYGMNKIYGLAEDDGSLAADGYWPAIIAQFGLIGAILMIYLLYNLYKFILNKSGKNRVSILCGISVCIITLISSIATSTFFHFTTMALLFVLIFNFDEKFNNLEEMNE